MGESIEESQLPDALSMLEAADRLETCRARWGGEGHPDRLREALHANLGLWSRLEAALSRPSAEIPGDLRTSLRDLASFVDQRTFEAQAQPGAARLEVLIDLNLRLARGLSAPGRPQVRARTGR